MKIDDEHKIFFSRKPNSVNVFLINLLFWKASKGIFTWQIVQRSLYIKIILKNPLTRSKCVSLLRLLIQIYDSNKQWNDGQKRGRESERILLNKNKSEVGKKEDLGWKRQENCLIKCAQKTTTTYIFQLQF